MREKQVNMTTLDVNISQHRVYMIKFVYIAPLVLALVGSTVTIGIARAQSPPWYDTGHDPIDCQDKDPMCCALIGCPLNEQKYVAGFRPLVGIWDMVNVTKSGRADFNSSGQVNFFGNGSMQLVFPKVIDTGVNDWDKSNNVTGMWASDGHSLVIVYPLSWIEATFTKKTPGHVELTDDHGDMIHMTRFSGQ